MTALDLPLDNRELTPGALLRRRLLAHPGFLFGATVLLAITIMALFAPLLAPHDPYAQDLSRRLVNPIWHDDGRWAHPFGTDHLGRDYLSRLIHGSRVALLIGFSTMLLSGVIGTSLGLAAGYLGGRIDAAITFIITARLAMPVILIALAVVVLVGASLQIVILVLGLLLWDRFAVVIRSATRQVRSREFVTAAEATGCSRLSIMLVEILPNVLAPLIVVATLEMTHAILLEAALSFLGLGVQPPIPAWGLMIAEGRDHMFFSPWIITIPGIALMVLVLGINLLGDGIRDVAAAENRN